MPRPIQQIHLDRRRIGKLHKKDLIAGNAANGFRVDLARQGVKAVQDQADMGMIGTAHHLPSVAVIVDMAPPSQRLIAQTQAPCGGHLAQGVEIGRSAVDAPHGSGMQG